MWHARGPAAHDEPDALAHDADCESEREPNDIADEGRRDMGAELEPEHEPNREPNREYWSNKGWHARDFRSMWQLWRQGFL